MNPIVLLSGRKMKGYVERIRYNFKVNCIFCNHLMCITCPIGENKKSLIICLIQHIGARAVADTHLKRWRRLNFSKLPTLMDISGSGFIHECALCSRRKRSALRSYIVIRKEFAVWTRYREKENTSTTVFVVYLYRGTWFGLVIAR